MRRKERLVTDMTKICECLDKSLALHVGFNDEGSVYVVPVNFGYAFDGDKLTLYYHGAKAGRKAELAAKKPEIGFCMETNTDMGTADTACGYTEYFLSIIGSGTLNIVEDNDEKIKGLNAVMVKASGKEWEYKEEMLNGTNVYRIDVSEFSCKENRKP